MIYPRAFIYLFGPCMWDGMSEGVHESISQKLKTSRRTGPRARTEGVGGGSRETKKGEEKGKKDSQEGPRKKNKNLLENAGIDPAAS